MAFSFGNTGSSMMGPSGGGGGSGGGGSGGSGGVTQGPDLETIQTERLGFRSLNGDARVQLTPSWPQAPSPTAALLSIAPRRGIIAAAGPEGIVLATTESVRKAFETPKNGDTEIRPFQAQQTISLPVRVSQLAFTADENFLIISAESGGGLAVYNVDSVNQGSTQSAFELSTNGESLRALVPNPMPELADSCAVVTDKGNLLMADLKGQKFVPGANGPALKTQVSCAAWSSKGKQLVAGLADGTVHQITPDGKAQGEIPKPPGLSDFHVASVAWLENHLFLVIHNSTNEQAPESAYHLITRNAPKGQAPSFAFQKLADPIAPFNFDKSPHHYLLRLRDFPPNLQDLLILSSTATPDAGLVSRAKEPLSAEKPAQSITGVFTTTELADDSKRASLPMSSNGMDDTIPIGVALDLSSKEPVYKPIPTDEIELSPGPLPGFWSLNNEGVLSCWWVVYTESIRSGTTYPGISAAQSSSGAPSTGPAAPSALSASPFGGSSTAAPAALSASSASPFGASTTAAPSFGGPSLLGSKPSPWGAAAAGSGGAAFGASTFGSAPAASAPKFGTPSFGSTGFNKPAPPAFGQSSLPGLGAKASPWGTANSGGSAPAFGQSGFASAGANKASPFGGANTSTSTPASGGFAGFANKGGFASLGSGASAGGSSIFGSGKPASSFTSTTSDVSMDTETAFPPPSKSGTTPGLGSTPFVLGTTFKADPSSNKNKEEPSDGKGGSSFFGSGFGNALKDSAKSATKDEDMVATPVTETAPQQKSLFGSDSTTPTTTPAGTKFGESTTPATSGGLFSSLNTKPNPFSGSFGTPKPAGVPSPGKTPSAPFGTPKIKVEENETPVPPESTSRAAYPVGESSSSSILSTVSTKESSKGEVAPTSKPSDAPPLPPDFLKATLQPKVDEPPLPPDPATYKPAVKVSDMPLPPGVAKESEKPVAKPLPADPAPPEHNLSPPSLPSSSQSGEGTEEGEANDEGYPESEGSGIDVGKDLTPPLPSSQTPRFTPQSSFGGMTGSSFTTIGRPEPEQPQSRRLFGEGSRAPLFPQPLPTSPRSPSPVRNAIPPRFMKSEATRSVSAPGMASSILGASRQGPPTLTSSIVGRVKHAEDPNVATQRNSLARREAEETQLLIDETDDDIRRTLMAEPEPTVDLPQFISHMNVQPDADATIPAQVECVYRDINSMLDTIGLNARAVKNFVLGHTQFGKDSRNKLDLEVADDWVLCELEDIGEIISEQLTDELEGSRVQDVVEKHELVKECAREVARLKAKKEDIQRIIMPQLDPDIAVANRNLPLNAEQAAQQNDIRREYAKFNQKLAEAEEAVALLKARIASVLSASGRKGGAGGGGANVPTVDAVVRTIMKMTSMAEKRSGDIDVLENQMRRLRLGTPGSREGSPFATPQKAGAGAGLRSSISVFSPSALRDTPRNSLVSSAGSPLRATPPRRKISGYTHEEKQAVREKRDRRQAVLRRLRSSLGQHGPNVWPLNEEDLRGA